MIKKHAVNNYSLFYLTFILFLYILFFPQKFIIISSLYQFQKVYILLLIIC